MPKVNDVLRTKNYRWRISYLIIRCFLDFVPSIFVVGCLSAYVESGAAEFTNNNNDVAIFFFEILNFLSLVKLQFTYEIPFICNQYGIMNNGIQNNSVIGIGLEKFTEWRNSYIVYFFIYKCSFSFRLICGGYDYMLVNTVFDYMFQYIIIIAGIILRSIYIKFFIRNNL